MYLFYTMRYSLQQHVSQILLTAGNSSSQQKIKNVHPMETGWYGNPGVPTTIKTMDVNITTIVYLRVLIIQIWWKPSGNIKKRLGSLLQVDFRESYQVNHLKRCLKSYSDTILPRKCYGTFTIFWSILHHFLMTP